ncbi:MAG: ABC transporter permease subunit [Thermoleophilaceae bacterium]|nr:ABC transporter permease subunit [Thermoleophilaceae bacterium]
MSGTASHAIPAAGGRRRAPRAAAFRALAAHTVRRRRRAPLAWGLPLGALSFVTAAAYPSIARSNAYDELLKNYPEALKKAFGVSDTALHTAAGYLAIEVFNLIAPLVVGVFMVRAASAALAGAEERGTLDALMSSPVSRRTVALAQFAGSAVTALAICVLVGGLTWIATLTFGVDLAAARAAAAGLALWPLALFSGGLALVVSALTHRGGVSTAVGAGVLVAMYFVEALGNLSKAIEPLKPLSAFHYYGSAIENGIEWPSFVGLCAAGVLLALAAARVFERRDVFA